MRPAVVLAVVLLAFVGARAQEEKKGPQPTRTWSGRVNEATKEALLKEAPTTGYLVDQAALEKLWKAWRDDEKPPQVDFSREAVFVHTAKGPNALKVAYTVDADGDLKAMAAATLVAGPGFSYVVDVLPRDGFKTFRGQPLAKTKTQ